MFGIKFLLFDRLYNVVSLGKIALILQAGSFLHLAVTLIFRCEQVRLANLFSLYCKLTTTKIAVLLCLLSVYSHCSVLQGLPVVYTEYWIYAAVQLSDEMGLYTQSISIVVPYNDV